MGSGKQWMISNLGILVSMMKDFRALRWIERESGSSKVMEFITTGELVIEGEVVDMNTLLQRSDVIADLIEKSKELITTRLWTM